MPFVLIIAGVVLLIAAVRGDACGQVQCHELLFALLARDFTGPNNFIYWFLAILIIGAVGYVPKLKPLSDGFLVLVILVLFLTKGKGFFDMFTSQIQQTQSATPTITANSSANICGLYPAACQGFNTGSGINIGLGSSGSPSTINAGPITIQIPGLGIGLPSVGGVPGIAGIPGNSGSGDWFSGIDPFGGFYAL
jgi:hypothetical protein